MRVHKHHPLGQILITCSAVSPMCCPASHVLPVRPAPPRPSLYVCSLSSKGLGSFVPSLHPLSLMLPGRGCLLERDSRTYTDIYLAPPPW